MKKLLFLAAAVIAVSGAVALADTNPPAPAGDQPPAPAATQPGSDDDGAGPADMQGHWHGMRDWWRHHADRDGRGHDMMDGSSHMGMPFAPPSRGASFVFEGPHGARVIVKCADADSTQQCVDAIKPMVDKVVDREGMPGPAGAPVQPAPAPAQ